MASAAKRLIPILDKVLLERVTAETTTGGVFLPAKLKATSIGCELARVVAVGNGKYTKNGKFFPVGVKKGDLVLLPDRPGTYVKIFGREFVLYADSELLGIVHED